MKSMNVEAVINGNPYPYLGGIIERYGKSSTFQSGGQNHTAILKYSYKMDFLLEFKDAQGLGIGHPVAILFDGEEFMKTQIVGMMPEGLYLRIYLQPE